MLALKMMVMVMVMVMMMMMMMMMVMVMRMVMMVKKYDCFLQKGMIENILLTQEYEWEPPHPPHCSAVPHFQTMVCYVS